MKESRVYVASAVFVLVTIIKLLLPEATREVRSKVVETIDSDMDYQAVLTQLGSVMTEDPVQEVMARFRGEEVKTQAVFARATVADLMEETLSILPDGWVEGGRTQGVDLPETPEPSPEPSPEPDPTPNPVPESVQSAVDAFLTAQSVFSEYALPDSVCYDDLILPFSYTAPVSGYTSSGFGFREHPIEHIVKFHYGTDYAVNSGTDILAFADGTVTEANWDDGYGNYIRIRHENGWSTLYAHCSQTFVQPGQTVTKGERIALAGDTGETTGPHLHFELLHNGLYTNPEFFL